MTNHSQVPEALRAGRRALEEFAGVTIIRDWTRGTQGSWYIEVAIKLEPLPAGPIPQVTRWFVVAEDHYPNGSLEIFPSKAGGITTTFRHQLHNSDGDHDCPWRRGNMCVTEPTAQARKRGQGLEPLTADARLRWRVERAHEWLEAASNDSLVRPGDPYEVPPVSSSGARWIVFNEDHSTFTLWSRCNAKFGTMVLKLIPQNPTIRVVTRFADNAGKDIFEPSWGSDIAGTSGQEIGVWIRIPNEPVVEQCHVPDNWEDLSQLLDSRGIRLGEVFASAYPYLRNGTAVVLAIGFPIPETLAGALTQMHWFFIQLPIIHPQKERKLKHKLRDCLFWERNRTIRPTGAINWQKSENWSPDQLGSRGQLTASLRKQRILLLGAGALGSSVAEMLVRGGTTTMTILDDDIVRAGNLVRHTLCIGDIGGGKATRLARRLNSVSPHAKVEGADLSFVFGDELIRTIVDKHTLVLDCTADDGVANDLSQFTWTSGTLVVSFALSFEAERLYVYAQRDCFDSSKMFSSIRPNIEEDLVRHPPEKFPREGIGCWHPVFPARIEQVLQAACRAVSFLSENIDSVMASGHFEVLD